MAFRKIALTLAAASCMLLAGCGDDASKTAQQAQAPAAAGSSAPLKAAWVYPSPVGGDGWSKQHDQSRQKIQKEFGDKIQTQYVENVTTMADAERVIRDLASQGNKIIFATSFVSFP